MINNFGPVKRVIELKPRDASLINACQFLGIQYIGFVQSSLHKKYLLKEAQHYGLKLMTKDFGPKEDFWYVGSDDAEKISSVYGFSTGVEAAEPDDDSSSSSSER